MWIGPSPRYNDTVQDVERPRVHNTVMMLCRIVESSAILVK